MKRSYLSLIALSLSTCFLLSCKTNSAKAQDAGEKADSLAINEKTESPESDTLVVKTDSCTLQEGESLYAIIKLDYPTGTDKPSQNVRKILNQKLADNYLGSTNEEGVSNYKAYARDLAQSHVVIEKYCNDNFKYLKDQVNDIKQYDSRANINMNYEINLFKIAENKNYITYNCFSYAYLAGAHGSSFDQSFNIVKATGKLLTETVDTTQVKKLQPLLRKGVISYLNEYNKEDPVTDGKLNEYLFIKDGIIPLPVNTPYLAEDGVHFAYQQYEIGPYAMGIITFTVPYADIKPFLTAEALKLTK